MFSKIQINKSTENYSQQIEQIKDKLNNADAVVIGAGAGLSTSAGFTYSGGVSTSTFPTLQRNTALPICIPAALWLCGILPRCSGHIGADLF